MLGLYDSGIGGTTILNEILASELKDLDILYYADLKNCPLGDKSDNQIRQIVTQAMEKMFAEGCDLIILACNTATSSCIRYLQQEWLPAYFPGKKILGIIRPTCEYLLEQNISPGSVIGLMATSATISRGFFRQELLDHGYTQIVNLACPGLADAIEKKDLAKINLAIEDCLEAKKLELTKLDVLLLACTHFPLAKKEIENQLKKYSVKKNLLILDQATPITQKLIKYLQNHPEIDLSANKKLRFLQNT
jgi:glutamate racemase